MIFSLSIETNPIEGKRRRHKRDMAQQIEVFHSIKGGACSLGYVSGWTKVWCASVAQGYEEVHITEALIGMSLYWVSGPDGSDRHHRP